MEFILSSLINVWAVCPQVHQMSVILSHDLLRVLRWKFSVYLRFMCCDKRHFADEDKKILLSIFFKMKLDVMSLAFSKWKNSD